MYFARSQDKRVDNTAVTVIRNKESVCIYEILLEVLCTKASTLIK